MSAYSSDYSTVINFAENYNSQSKSYKATKSAILVRESFSYFTEIILEPETDAASIPEPVLFIIYQLLFIIYWKKLVLCKS